MEHQLSDYEFIVIGVSLGGMEALATILSELDESFSVPIAIVQHMSPDFRNLLSDYLGRICRLCVKEAEDKEPLLPGTVYIAPADYHLLIEESRTAALSREEKVCFARPSIDVLFESAADVYRDKLIGIILTGASSDGSRGLKKIKDYGGFIIVQDPDTAVSSVMPREAIRATEVDRILPLTDIGIFLNGIRRKAHE